MKKLKKHDPLTRAEIKAFHERMKQGVEKGAASFLGYSSCSPCEPTTPNGGCYEVSEVCTWIPDIG